jgi:hypothetical protein
VKVRKFCLCGCKLERDAADEESARELVWMWRNEHSGEGHGPANEKQYLRAVSRIVGNKAKRNHPKEFKPMLSPRMRFRVIEGGKP